MAYNNRGNSYGNLDQLERAIEDYNEAIRLDPRFSLVYSNRALAYTYLGRDEEARADVDRGTELGLDPSPLIAKLEEVKNNR
jgi:tetratricopeptide (TPR) repeat protein